MIWFVSVLVGDAAGNVATTIRITRVNTFIYFVETIQFVRVIRVTARRLVVWRLLFCCAGREGVWNGLDVLVMMYTWLVLSMLLTR